ncbi:hypothetical protein G5I_03488 [Acromyrmex echinatior]|uniref:Uncharacterized protein n=1 Tax=Acromyrmex echinatior TaxID=103372 RepID=F4WD39_ACREC|nr:hypothetical protein G5I_03488 [Acromyrmex echinatior]
MSTGSQPVAQPRKWQRGQFAVEDSRSFGGANRDEDKKSNKATPPGRGDFTVTLVSPLDSLADARPSRPWKVLDSLTSCVLSRALAKRATAQMPGSNPSERTQGSLSPRGALSRLIGAWLRGSANRGNRVMSWRAKFERSRNSGVFFRPPHGLEVPIRGSRRPWGVEWPSPSCRTNSRSALRLEEGVIRNALR